MAANGFYKELNLQINKSVGKNIQLGKLTNMELSLFVMMLSVPHIDFSKGGNALSAGDIHRYERDDKRFIEVSTSFINWFITGNRDHGYKCCQLKNHIKKLCDKLASIFNEEVFESLDYEEVLQFSFTDVFAKKYVVTNSGKFFLVDLDTFMALSKNSRLLYLLMAPFDNNQSNIFRNNGYVELYFTPAELAKYMNKSNSRKDNVADVLRKSLLELKKVFPCATLITAGIAKDSRKTTRYYLRWMPKHVMNTHNLDKRLVAKALQANKENVRRRKTKHTQIKGATQAYEELLRKVKSEEKDVQSDLPVITVDTEAEKYGRCELDSFNSASPEEIQSLREAQAERDRKIEELQTKIMEMQMELDDCKDENKKLKTKYEDDKRVLFEDMKDELSRKQRLEQENLELHAFIKTNGLQYKKPSTQEYNAAIISMANKLRNTV